MSRILFPFAVIAFGAFGQSPEFRSNELVFPADYREWVFLSSGLGMTYGPNAPGPLENPMFDTVFVNPSAYQKFKETGKWPEGTFFVLEIRYSTSEGSINKGGFYQSDVAAIEVNLKDSRYPGGWGFFDFAGGLRPRRAQAAELGERANGCRACHSTNGAVESTFTQFYPAALAIAQKKGTVKASYKPPSPSPVELVRTLREKGWDEAEQLLATAKSTDPKAGILREGVLNQVGYAVLGEGDQKKAVELFRWITRTFPSSANALDSLAEAYETAGQKQEAIEASEKALALLETDRSINDDRRTRVKQAIETRLAKLRK